MDWEFEISRCKLLNIGWKNEALLGSTGNYIQYPVINRNGNGKKNTKKNLYVYVCVNTRCHSAGQRNEHDPVNPLYFNKVFFQGKVKKGVGILLPLE